MLAEFQQVWAVIGEIFSAMPSDVVTVGSFIFCSVGIIGIMRAF